MAALLSLSLALAGRIDLNHASVQELQALRGVGPSKAASIVAWREARGPCSKPEELLDAPGIGLGTWRAVRHQVVCGGDGVEEAGLMIHPPPPSRRPTVVNLNTATAAELLSLAGMTPQRAAWVVSDRDARGPYASCREVERVPGFGPATVAAWGERCAASDAPARPEGENQPPR